VHFLRLASGSNVGFAGIGGASQTAALEASEIEELTQSLLEPVKRRSLALPNRQYSPPPSLDSLAVSSIPLDVLIKFLKISYFGYHFPAEIIHHTIWLYLRFMLKFRDVEDLLTERKILVAYETVRR
jgi:hypothetical protein